MSRHGAPHRLEGNIDSFLSEPRFHLQEIFSEERFPNVVVALDGTVIATWGSRNLVARRSEDGGASWGERISVGDGIHAGGSTVDETTGDILFFGHPEHPYADGSPTPRMLFRSRDAGCTWVVEEAVFWEDGRGYLPALHFSERGITLRRGEYAGRLLRLARVFQATTWRCTVMTAGVPGS